MDYSFITLGMEGNWTAAMGWTVVHSLWQGTLVALLVGGLSVIFKKQSPVFRYWLGLCGLLTQLIWSTLTFFQVFHASSNYIEYEVTVGSEAHTIILVDQGALQTYFGSFINYFEQHLPLIVSLWFLGMSFFLLRFLGGLAYVQHLKVSRVSLVPTDFEEMLEELQSRLGMGQRSIQLLESAKIRVPMTIGYLRPVILMPAGALLALSPAQVEAVLAHELAHIHRKDYLLNIFQSFVEVLFYYHPAIWWISAQTRIERENCCDDIAVSLCGDDLEYAKALLSLQEYARMTPTFVMAFSSKKNHLLHRVHRILNHPINKNSIMEKFSITTLILFCILIISMGNKQSASTQNVFTEQNEAIPMISEGEAFEVATPALVPAAPVDTIPQGKVNVSMTKDGEKIEAKLEKGKILELKVNGEVQPASTYEAYFPIIESVLETPPPPPLPPLPSISNSPPAPPTPPTPPGAPPAPKAVTIPSIKLKNKVSVTTNPDEEGNAVIFIRTEDGQEPMEIKVTGQGDDKVVLLNGEVIATDEEFVIVGDDKVVELAPGTYQYNVNGVNVFTTEQDGQNSFVWVDSDGVATSISNLEKQKEELLQQIELLAKESEGKNRTEILKLERMLKELEADYGQRQNAVLARVKMMDERKLKEQERRAKSLSEANQRMAEMNERASARNEERARAMAERVAKMEERAAARAANNAWKEEWLESMVNEGLLESTDNYSITFSKDMLKINGKRQPKAIQEKYLKLYEEYGNKMSSKDKITMKKTSN